MAEKTITMGGNLTVGRIGLGTMRLTETDCQGRCAASQQSKSDVSHKRHYGKARPSDEWPGFAALGGLVVFVLRGRCNLPHDIRL